MSLLFFILFLQNIFNRLVMAHTVSLSHSEHSAGFFSTYVFSQDHKIIAKQFLITGMFWAVVGALLSVVFRLQLAYPGESFSWLQDILGRWTPEGRLTPDTYYAFVTMHGTVLVFFVLTGALLGTFANLLIPFQIGARDMASPVMNMISYWLFFVSSVIILASFFIQTGPAGVAWTLYPPLSALGEASVGARAGVDFWIIGMAVFVFSSTIGSLNYVTTVLNMRTKGMTLTRLPLTIWSFVIAAFIGILAFPPLVAGLIMLLFDRHAGSSFYLSEIFINGKALLNEGGSALLYQHLFWFLGHPEVYIIIIPAMGIVSEVMSTCARKPIFGYTAMIFSMVSILFLSLLVWAHHLFVAGMNPFLGLMFTIFTLLISIPSAVKVFNWLATLWRGNIIFTPAMLFCIGFVSYFISGGLTGLWLGNSSLDIHLHDTMFVVGHFHIVMGLAGGSALFAGVYHWFPKMFGRQMNSTLGYIHFWGTLVAGYCIFWPMHYMGLAGMPRRYFDYTGWTSFSSFQDMQAFVTISAVVFFLVQVIFLINFFHSIFYGKKLMDPNPWKSNTLEWTTPIERIHGNWPGALPEVFRGPYDYGRDGRDCNPQNQPLTPNEQQAEH